MSKPPPAQGRQGLVHFIVVSRLRLPPALGLIRIGEQVTDVAVELAGLLFAQDA